MDVSVPLKKDQEVENQHVEQLEMLGIPRQPLFTIREAAVIFKVHSRTVERWIDEGHIDAVVLPRGKSLRLTYQEVLKVCGQDTTLDDM